VVAKYSGDSANAGSTSPVLSQTVTSVTDTTPPSVSITSPTAGATLNGLVTIGVKATDNIAVALITLSVDGAVVATTNNSQLSYKWNTNKLKSGSHTISAIAKDTSGNQATTSIIVRK